MLIDVLNNTFIFNESALKLINSSKISIFATYFLLIINFVFLTYVIFEINKLYKKKKLIFLHQLSSLLFMEAFQSFWVFLSMMK